MAPMHLRGISRCAVIPSASMANLRTKLPICRTRAPSPAKVSSKGFGALELATTDIAPVVANADFIFIVAAANAHAFMAQVCAPYPRDDQVIILNPGRTGGTLEFRKVLRERGVKARVFMAKRKRCCTLVVSRGPRAFAFRWSSAR